MARTARPSSPADPLFSNVSRAAGIEWVGETPAPASPPGPDEVDAILGSGVHGVTPIAFEPGRRIRELSLSYSDIIGAWFRTPGTEADPTAAGSLKTVEESRSCLGCHATTLAWEDDTLVSEHTVLGIQCERCHGPGSTHVEAMSAGGSDSRIVNPARLPADRQVEFCAQCHRLPTDLEPLDVLGRAPALARHAGAGLMMSACFRKSPPDATLTCTQCHSPHRNIETTDQAQFNATCLQCHQEPDAAHRYERVDSRSDCVSCHMPAERQGFHGLSFADHWIRSPGTPPPLGTDNESEALGYLETRYRDEWERDEPGLERKSRLALGLAEVLLGLDRPDEAHQWVSESLRHAPKTQQRLKAAAMLRQGGKLSEAESVLDAAITSDPSLVRAHFDLGEIARQQREWDAAETRYRAAIALRPDFAAAHASLAAVLRERGRLDAALEHYRDADRLRPEDPLIAEGLAYILAAHPSASQREPETALRLAERAASATAYRHPVVLDTLAAAYAASGDYETARGAARRALEIATGAGALELAAAIESRLALYENDTPFVAAPR